MICSRRFILYHGSRIWTCRIFLKSRPSLPATDIMTTFTFSPCVLSSLVSAFSSKRLSGEIVGSPVITEYRAGRNGWFGNCAWCWRWGSIVIASMPGVGLLRKSDEFPPVALYRVNPISSNASAMGTTPPSIY